MANQFYVWQRVMGEQGQIVIVIDPRHGSSNFKGILIDGAIKNQPVGYISSGWSKECFVDFPIDPPSIVLTDWQEKKLIALLKPIAAKIDGDIDAAIKRINDILSEPEPPKFIPKEGEVCLLRDGFEDVWIAGEIAEIDTTKNPYRAGKKWFNQCRPFAFELIGTNYNPPI